LMSGRPYLSLFHKRSSSHEILSAAGGGISLAFESNTELVALEHALSRAIVRLVTDPSSLGHADPSAYAPYTARATAEQFAAIFNRLSGNKAERSLDIAKHARETHICCVNRILREHGR